MGPTRSAVWRPLSAAIVAGIATLGIVARTPAYISFGVVVGAAISWCIWLERHPPA